VKETSKLSQIYHTDNSISYHCGPHW